MVTPHFHGLYSSLLLCCDSSLFTSIQDRCDKGVHQSYLGTERNAPIIPKLISTLSKLLSSVLSCPEEYLKFRTIATYNWAQVLEACDCLKLLSTYWYFKFSVLMPPLSSQHRSSCLRLRRLCRHAQLILSVFLPLLLSHQPHEHSRDWDCSLSNADSAFMIF